LRSAWFTDPVVWLGAAFGAAATAAAVFAGRYLPYIDWGAHLGLISVLAHGNETGALAFFERSFGPSPYLLFYLVTALFGQVVPVDEAAKIVLVVIGGGLCFAAASFAEATGRSPRIGLIAPLAMFNLSLAWGFGSFVIATPILFFALGSFERWVIGLDREPEAARERTPLASLRAVIAVLAIKTRPLRRSAAACATWLVLLYLAHGFLFACAALVLLVRSIVHAIARRSFVPLASLAIVLLIPALTVLPAALMLLRNPTVEAGTESHRKLVELQPVAEHIASFASDTLDRGSADHFTVMFAALSVLILWLAWSRVQAVRTTPRTYGAEITAAVLWVLYLFGPMTVNWPSSIWLVYPRFAILAALSAALLPRADLRGRLGTILAFAALLPVGWNAAINAGHIRHFSVWAKPYDEVRALIPKKARVLALTVPTPGDPPIEHHAIGSLFTYLMVDGASYVAFLFDKPELPVHIRHDVTIRAPYWQTPWFYDPKTHGVDYDYLVLRGRDLIQRTDRAGLHTLVKEVGPWSVYKTNQPRTIEQLSTRRDEP
jgi:hypothetical protein